MLDIQELDLAIKRAGVTTTFICEKLGISRTSFYNKRKGKVSFKASEIGILKTVLHLTTKQIEKIFML